MDVIKLDRFPAGGVNYGSRSKPDHSLHFDWSHRERTLTRFNRIDDAFKNAGLGIKECVIHKDVRSKKGWPKGLFVSPVDLMRQQGIDPEDKISDGQYCALFRGLFDQLKGIEILDGFERFIKSNKVRLDRELFDPWLNLPSLQEKGAPLIVRSMPVNPAIWFEYDKNIITFAPACLSDLMECFSSDNTYKKVLFGDILTVLSFVIGEGDHLINPLKSGTCPGIDIPGTMIKCDGWMNRPYIGKNRMGSTSKVVLGACGQDIATAIFGPFGCAY